MNVLYEVHIFRDQTWKVDSVYDDKALAIYEAQRIHLTGRFLAVRVIEETFDLKTDRRTIRPVYVTNKLPPRSKKSVGGNVAVDDSDERRVAYSAAPAKRKSSGLVASIVMRLLAFVVILLAGIGFLIWIEGYLNKHLS